MTQVFQPHWYGPFELLRHLGQGGMAEVFLARSGGARGFSKISVVKRMLKELTQRDDLVELFVGEAKLAVHLQHANIVQIFGLEEVDAHPVIVMEYVHGRDLHNVLRRSQQNAAPLPVDFGLHCIAEMLKGLHHAHTALGPDGKPLQLVHRDVTPSNVFISFDGEVKLGDFGVAHREGGIKITDMRGKLGYMAPEILRGQVVDARSDIFSAGVVLWETLAQRRLFVGNTTVEILSRIGNHNPEPPSRYNTHVAPDLDSITLRALEKDREARFQSALEFEEAISDFLFARRLRWTRRRIADVMQAHYAEEAKPLVLPPALPRARKRVPTPVAIENVADATTHRITRALAGLEQVPQRPPQQQDDNPWPESIESQIVDVQELNREHKKRRDQPSSSSADFVVSLRGQAQAQPRDLVDLMTTLRDHPREVDAVGIDSETMVDRASLATLSLWDSLAGFSEPLQQPAAETSRQAVSLTRLLFELTVRRMTGLLVAENDSGQRRRLLYLEDGYPLYVCSDHTSDGAPALILDNKMLPPDVLQEGMRTLIRDRVTLDRALVQANPAQKNRFEKIFSAIVRSRLYAAFSWTDGRVRVFSGVLPPARLMFRMPPLLGILVRGARRGLSLGYLQSRSGLQGHSVLRMQAKRDAYLKALRLRPLEQLAVEAIDGKRDVLGILREVGALNNEAQHSALAVLYVLLETHLAQVLR